jgi:uncharacterized protein (UPF0332 family)
VTAFNPADFFALAEQLYASHKTAPGYRTTVGRAYYAAFLSARNQAGISSREKDGHLKVIQHYRDKNPGNPKFAAIGNRLDALRIQRTDADYDCEKSVESRDAGKALSSSRNIIESLSSLKT